VQVPRQREAGATPGTGRFPALVLAPSEWERDLLGSALRSVGAGPVVLGSSASDFLRRFRLPGDGGIGAILLPLHDESVLQLVAQLRACGWRRVVMTAPRLDPATVRIAIAAKVRCLVTQPGREQDDEAASHTGDLSPREIEVLQAVADGNTNNDIGEILGLSGLTVKSHLARIGRKLGTGDRAEMVAKVMRAGLVR
jgi:DNA-binding CsgD family transcriptional regulator